MYIIKNGSRDKTPEPKSRDQAQPGNETQTGYHTPSGYDTPSSNHSTLSPTPSTPSPFTYTNVAETYLHWSNGEKVYLPSDPDLDIPVDEFFKQSYHDHIQTQTLKHHDNHLLHNPSFLNVIQGELAHVSSLTKLEWVGSTNATTCHVLALWSTHNNDYNNKEPHHTLASLAHIDRVGYDSCLQAMVEQHLNHHNNQTDSSCNPPSSKRPRLTNSSTHTVSASNNPVHIHVHLVGGFLDKAGLSQQLSTDLLWNLADLAHRYRAFAHFTLQTCIISSVNNHPCLHSSLSQPAARGLMIHVKSGNVRILQSVPSALQGPCKLLREARLWSRSNQKLNIIFDHHTLTIRPFEYRFRSFFAYCFTLEKDELLRRTSTSPHCEATDYCDIVCNTFKFMHDYPANTIFGPQLDKVWSFIFDANKWVRVNNSAKSTSKSWFDFVGWYFWNSRFILWVDIFQLT